MTCEYRSTAISFSTITEPAFETFKVSNKSDKEGNHQSGGIEIERDYYDFVILIHIQTLTE